MTLRAQTEGPAVSNPDFRGVRCPPAFSQTEETQLETITQPHVYHSPWQAKG